MCSLFFRVPKSGRPRAALHLLLTVCLFRTLCDPCLGTCRKRIETLDLRVDSPLWFYDVGVAKFLRKLTAARLLRFLFFSCRLRVLVALPVFLLDELERDRLLLLGAEALDKTMVPWLLRRTAFGLREEPRAEESLVSFDFVDLVPVDYYVLLYNDFVAQFVENVLVSTLDRTVVQ